MDYTFNTESLNPENRKEGISAYIRTRNGGQFLKLVIESHIDYFDEIIACYNDCTDNTEEVLKEMEQKYPEKLKVYHYEPKVHPPGSKGHLDKKKNILNSFSNYSNFALSKTTRKIAVKLDDDHYAVSKNLREAVTYIKEKSKKNCRYTFCGLNVLKKDNTLGIFEKNPYSGGVDIDFFPVSKETYYTDIDSNEAFICPKMKRKYMGILYIHLKYLKDGQGFSNYQLHKKENKDSKYHKDLNFFKNNATIQSIQEFSNTPMHKLLKRKSYIKLALYKLIKSKKIFEFSGLDYKAGLKNSRAILFKHDMIGVKESIQELKIKLEEH